MYLYIDTTDHIIVGLLSDEFQWLEYHEEKSIKRSSNELHHTIYKILEKHELKFSKLRGFLFAAGPGSYTGMRLSEGIAQICEWQGIRVNSFYHVDVPHLLKSEEGVWFSKAFKGEYFFYEWKRASENKSRLLNEEDFIQELKKFDGANIYTNFEDKKLLQNLDIDIGITSTAHDIRKFPRKFFQEVVDGNLRFPPLYYRSEESEFKIPAK